MAFVPGRDSRMKQTGMLVVSLRGVNFGCLVSLRVFRAKNENFKPQGLVQGSMRRNRENKLYFQYYWYLLGVTKCLSHTHIGLFQRLDKKFPTSIPVCFIWESPPGIYCRRPGEPAILISTLLLQTHARQFCSLALTFRESSTKNVWNSKNAI